MNIRFSCALEKGGGQQFARLVLHIGGSALGDGWEVSGTIALCLQTALARLATLQHAPDTTPLADIPLADNQFAPYYDTPAAALPYGASTFDGEWLLLFKYRHCAGDLSRNRYAAVCQAYGQDAVLIADFPFQAYCGLLRQLAGRLDAVQAPWGGRLLVYGRAKAA